MTITAALVKELRQRTSAGMMECKKALVEADGDINLAAEKMREAGLAKADKKADRIAAEGRIAVSVDTDTGSATIIEVNCETDFVSKGDIFGDFSSSIAKAALDAKTDDIESIGNLSLENDSVDITRRGLITTLGENISLRRAFLINNEDAVNGYVHGGGKVGVIISATTGGADKVKVTELLRNIAMHASAMKPTTVSYLDLDLDFIAKETAARKAEIIAGNEELVRLGKPEKRIPQFVSRHQLTDEALEIVKDEMKASLKAEGKPEAIWDRIIPGQMERFIKDNTSLDQDFALLSQSFVMDDSKTVEQAIAEVGADIKITNYIRYELGDGIEKKEDNFVEEVMAQSRGA